MWSTTRYSEALETCREILSKKICTDQLQLQVAMHQCRILFYMGKNMECVTRGLEALSVFEPRLSSFLNNSKEIPQYETELLKGIVKATRTFGFVETFKRLPILEDAFLLAAHSLLIEMIAPLAWAAPQLLHTLPLFGVFLTFKHGKNVQSVVHVHILYGFSNVRCRCSRSIFLIPIARMPIEVLPKLPWKWQRMPSKTSGPLGC